MIGSRGRREQRPSPAGRVCRARKLPAARAQMPVATSAGGRAGNLYAVRRLPSMQGITMGAGRAMCKSGILLICDGAEYGCIGSDAQRERENRHRGCDRAVNQPSQAVPDVVTKGMHFRLIVLADRLCGVRSRRPATAPGELVLGKNAITWTRSKRPPVSGRLTLRAHRVITSCNLV